MSCVVLTICLSLNRLYPASQQLAFKNLVARNAETEKVYDRLDPHKIITVCLVSAATLHDMLLRAHPPFFLSLRLIVTAEWLALQLPFIIINTGKDDDVECEIDDNMYGDTGCLCATLFYYFALDPHISSRPMEWLFSFDFAQGWLAVSRPLAALLTRSL
jgi:hypothetical protein